MSLRALPCLALSLAILLPGFRSQMDAQQAQATAPAGKPGASATVHGTVADPDAAVIPGATVTLTPASGNPLIVQSQSDGTYIFRNVPPGVYSETITIKGFATYVRQGVRIAPAQSLTIDAKLAIQQQDQQVNVTTNGVTLSTDPDSNASATVIKGKDLDALSDDPDELSSELTALAGPSAGPNGGQIYVDGFTGGQLPPKSSIREIRINQNPFSAQYDRVGYGRVEVFTKPGTDKFHGFFQVNGNASFLNTSNPLIGTTPQLPYHTIFVLGSLTGPISSKASFSLGGSHRIIQDNLIFDGTLLVDAPGSTTLCPSGTVAAPSPCIPQATSIPVLFPQVRTDFTPRIDYQLTPKNTFTARYQYETNSQPNDGIGSLDLPSTGYNLDATENTLQITDSQIISDRMINETHLEYERDHSTQNPLSAAPTITVQGAFTSGGSSTQVVDDHQDHIEVQNYTSLAMAKNFIRFGGRLRTTRDANYSNSQSLGIFTYSSLQAANAKPDSNNVISAYDIGVPSQYVVAQINQGSVHATLADLGLYLEDDWKPKPNLTVSYGIRFETQNHIPDHADVAPRVSFAYGVPTKKSTPQTVLRGGFGLFYDRFTLTNVITTEQENGVNQRLYTIDDPGPACTPSNQSACLTNTGTTGVTTYTISPRLHSPYLMQLAVGVDEQLGKFGTLSVNYLNMHGVHQFNSDNAAAPLPEADGTIPTLSPGTPNLYQFASDGLFRQNQLSISPRVNYRRSLSLFGFYVLNFARSDTTGSGYFPSVVGNLRADYGRASFDVRSKLFIGGSYSAPHRVSISPFLVANSGTPFNIITGTDLNHDGILTNDRPAYASASTLPQNLVQTAHGNFDVDPAPGVPRVPINSGTGPATFTLNLRMTKTFGFGKLAAPTTASGSQGQSGPPGGAFGGGGPRGGGGGGGPRSGGGPFGGGASSGKRFSLSFGVLASNIFNVADLGTPSGVVGSPEFYKSTQLAGRPFTSNTALRAITLLSTFSF